MQQADGGLTVTSGQRDKTPLGFETDRDPEFERLKRYVEPSHLRRRLGIEADHEAEVFHRAGNFFHLENWDWGHALIRNVLRLLGVHGRGRRNTVRLQVQHNQVELANLPAPFQGYRILQITDLHLDMRPDIPDVLIERIEEAEYDICVLTGDYRALTHGEYQPAMEALARVRPHIQSEVFAILGNHDTIRMVPAMEEMGIRVLMNESVALEREGAAIYLAGVDDYHYYNVANLDRATQGIPEEAIAILLSHTPEIYRHACHDVFDLVLCGHTHGGQICLPGGWPLYPNAKAPREYCVGPWEHKGLIGYTSRGSGVSVVDVRLNCPPEITVHELQPRSVA